jgi:PAS domain S-box-containing protein
MIKTKPFCLFSIIKPIKLMLNRSMKHFIITFLSVLLLKTVFSQGVDMRFKHLTISDGLSQVCVNSIIQDKEGFIWIATHDGLNKYDGYAFKVYKPDAKNRHSIFNNIIKIVYEDNDGIIWVGTGGGGLCKFDKKTEEFTTYLNDPRDKSSISSNDVFSIFEDSKGRFWVGTFGGGLNLFDKKTGKFNHFISNPNQPSSIGGNAIRVIVEDHLHNVWIGIDGAGLDLFNEKTNDFSHFRHTAQSTNTISNDIVMTILVDKDNFLWLGTYDGGLNKFNPSTKTFEQFHHNSSDPYSLPCETIWSSYEYSDSTLMFGSRGAGLCLFNKKTKHFTSYNYNQLDKYSISDEKILCIMKDRTGLMWFGTENNGINIYDKQSSSFELNKNVPNNSNSISNNNVMAMKQQGSILWLGTRGGGLNSLDFKTGEIKHYQTPKLSKYDFSQILSLDFAPDGMLWLGSDGNGIFLYNPQNGKTENFRYEVSSKSNQLSNNSITSIVQTNDSILWIGTWGGGLNKYNFKKRIFTNVPIGSSNVKNVVWCLYKDNDGVLWVGTNGNGLMRFNPNTFEKTFYKNERNNPSTLSNNVIHFIMESSDGAMWIGTGGGGLNKFDKKTQKFITYDQKDGLPNDIVLGIIEDEKRNLWLSTANGISKFSPSTTEFVNFYEENGLQGNSFNERSCFKNSEGKIYFGGPKGLTSFYPKNISNISFSPPVVINDFKVFNSSVKVNTLVNDAIVLTKPIYLTDTIVLSYKQSVFSFEFAALDYVSPFKNKYQYKMEGFDENWINADANQRFVTYTNLPGGQFVFKVRASNSEGIWNNKGASLHIIIIPPYYKTLWFYVLLTIIIGFIVYRYIQIREKQILKKREHIELGERATLLQIESEKLKESEDKFRKMFSNHNAVMLLIDPTSGRIVDANLSACKFYKYSHETLCSKLIQEIYDTKNDVEFQILIKSIAQNQNKSIYTHILGDGSTRIVEVDSAPLETKNEKYYFSIIYDITDRKLAEKEAEEFSTRLSLATIAGGVGVWDYNINKNELLWDDQMYKLYGINHDTFSTPLDARKMAILPTDFDRVNTEVEMAVKGEKEFDTEYRIILPDNSVRTVRAMAIVQYDEDAKPFRLIGTNWDITDQKRLENELIKSKESAEAASVAKSDFLATMSHEIRTPLNGVIGFSDILIKTKLSEKQLEYMKNVHVSANSLLDLVNDILDFSKIEAGKLDLNNEKVDLIDLAGNIIEIMKFKVAEKGIESLLNISTDIPRFITADPVRLRQVLINLLGNATKFTSKGEIELKIESIPIPANEKEMLFVFSVRDTGIGIPKDKQKTIFESFSQADSSTTRKYGGTGLGLAISSNLVKKMGSTIEVDSIEGEGSCFYFTVKFPFERGDTIETCDISSIKKVLVVDDNATNRSIVEAMLKTKNIITDQASNGLIALEKIEKNDDYDVVILDYHMPDIDGLEVMSIIRQCEKGKQLPIIFLHSSSDDDTVFAACKALDVKLIMQKPLRMAQLFRAFSKIHADIEIETDIIDDTNSELEIPKSLQKYTVLIVDDNQMNLNLASSLVQINMPEAIIIETLQGTEACSLYLKHNPDIVLMDIQMPVINGYEASAAIRATEQDQKRRIPIIALTAGTVAGEKERCVAAGMNDYLAKPLNSKLLFQLFDKYLHGNTSATITQATIVEDSLIHFDRAGVLEKYDNDEQFVEMFLNTAFETMPQYTNELIEAINHKDVKQIKFNAHSLKGMARGIGFNVMTDLSLQIEHHSDSDFEKCNELCLMLVNEYEFLKSEFSQ